MTINDELRAMRERVREYRTTMDPEVLHSWALEQREDAANLLDAVERVVTLTEDALATVHGRLGLAGDIRDAITEALDS